MPTMLYLFQKAKTEIIAVVAKPEGANYGATLMTTQANRQQE